MLVVVPTDELLHPGAAMFATSEAFGIVRLVLERLELCLAEGVVIGDVGATEAASDTQGGEEVSECRALHGRAAIGMHDELTRNDAMAVEGFGEQEFRELLAL